MVLGDARSGSTVLVNALNSHPKLRCFREPFNWAVNFIDYAIDGWDPRSVEDMKLRADDPVAFLDQRLFGDHPPQFSAIGFKFLYPHFWGFPGLLEHLQQRTELRVIHIVRRNSLRALVSLRIAEKTGQWVDDARRPGDGGSPVIEASPGTTRNVWRRRITSPLRSAATRLGIGRSGVTVGDDGRPRVRLSRSECQQYFALAQRRHTHWASLFESHPIATVTYEDLLSDRDAVLATIQGFLDVPIEPLTVTMRRQNPEPLTVLLENYDALKRAFAGTRHATFFVE